jgi:hypothetical protein
MSFLCSDTMSLFLDKPLEIEYYVHSSPKAGREAAMNQPLQVNSYAEKLALCEINDIPKHWKPRNGWQKDFTGRCYEMGIRYVTTHGGIEGMLLVHGAYIILSRGSLYSGHCWVELPEGIVYDGTLCKFYTQEGYAQVTGATAFRKYTINEVARESKKYGYYALGFDEKFPGARHAYLMTRVELERVLLVIKEG